MPKVAVITPYYQESTEILQQCHQSVLAQGDEVVHYMVADGHPSNSVDRWNVRHVKLPASHNDNGSTPRGIGSILAEIEGFEYIAYLDADNWYHPNHISSLLDVREERKVQVACALRTFHHPNGDEMLGATDKEEIAHRHVDTSCFLIHKDAFESIRMWTSMPSQLGPICDAIFLIGLKKMNCTFGFSDKKTVAFRTQYVVHYRSAGIEPPDGAKIDIHEDCVQWLLSVDGVRETVRRLKFFPL